MGNLSIIYLQASSPDQWQLRSWKVAIVTGLVAAIVALITAIAGLIQRARETRWKQAELARKLLDDIFDFQPAYNALIMIDEFKESFQMDGGQTTDVSFRDIDQALMVPIQDHSEQARFIRRCFDALLYYLERIEQSIQIKIVIFADIKNPAEYYVERLALHKKSLSCYLTFTKYSGATAFLERFSSWNNSSS